MTPKPEWQRLVDEPGRLPADPQLEQHEVRAVQRGVPVTGEREASAPAQPVEHPSSEAADHLESFGIDVEQDKLVDRQSIGADGRTPRPAPGCTCFPHPTTVTRCPSLRAGGVLTRLLITLSVFGGPRKPQSDGHRNRGGAPRLARFRLELGPVPLHHQVYLDLLSSLDAGAWRPGDQLPTERDLATHYGCSLITVRRALDELVREGRIERTRGRGHVRPPSTAGSRHRERASFTEEMRQRGLDPETRLVSARPESASVSVAAAARPRSRLADALSRAAPAGQRGPVPPRAGPPSRRAVPRPARERPRARLALRAAVIPLRDARRARSRGPRARPPPGSRGPPAGPASRRARTFHRRHRLRRRRHAGRIRPDASSAAIALATTSNATSIGRSCRPRSKPWQRQEEEPDGERRAHRSVIRNGGVCACDETSDGSPSCLPCWRCCSPPAADPTRRPRQRRAAAASPAAAGEPVPRRRPRRLRSRPRCRSPTRRPSPATS